MERCCLYSKKKKKLNKTGKRKFPLTNIYSSKTFHKSYNLLGPLYTHSPNEKSESTSQEPREVKINEMEPSLVQREAKCAESVGSIRTHCRGQEHVILHHDRVSKSTGSTQN